MEYRKNNEYTITTIENHDEILKNLNYYNKYFPISLQEMVRNLEEYAKKIQEKARIRKIVNAQQQQLGMLVFYANDKKAYTGFLSLIVVDNDYSNKGIGSILIEYFEEYCKSCGMQKTRLEVLKENGKAIQFYKKHNYTIVKEEEKSYYMEKNLKEID